VREHCGEYPSKEARDALRGESYEILTKRCREKMGAKEWDEWVRTTLSTDNRGINMEDLIDELLDVHWTQRG